MPVRFHLNAKGEPGVCRATVKPCPLGGPADHYMSKVEALKAYKLKQVTAGGASLPRMSRKTLQSLAASPMVEDQLEAAATGHEIVIRTLLRNNDVASEALAAVSALFPEDSSLRREAEEHIRFKWKTMDERAVDVLLNHAAQKEAEDSVHKRIPWVKLQQAILQGILTDGAARKLLALPEEAYLDCDHRFKNLRRDKFAYNMLISKQPQVEDSTLLEAQVFLKGWKWRQEIDKVVRLPWIVRGSLDEDFLHQVARGSGRDEALEAVGERLPTVKDPASLAVALYGNREAGRELDNLAAEYSPALRTTFKVMEILGDKPSLEDGSREDRWYGDSKPRKQSLEKWGTKEVSANGFVTTWHLDTQVMAWEGVTTEMFATYLKHFNAKRPSLPITWDATTGVYQYVIWEKL